MGGIVFLLVSISIYQFCLTVINADDGLVSYACAGTILNVTDNYVYQDNVNSLLDNLASNSLYLNFYNSSAGEGDNKFYGLYQCRYDVGLDNCSACVGSATRRILSSCVSSDEAIVWYYECMLWYSNSSTILTVAKTDPSAILLSATDVSNYKEFAPILANATGDVIRNAYKSRSQYAFGEKDYSSHQHLYTYAQCILGIGPSMCHRCLQLALKDMLQLINQSAFATVFYPSCQLWYDTVNPILAPVPTYGPDTNALAGPKNSKTTSIKPGIIAAIAILASVGLLGAAAVLWICLFRRKRKEESRDVDPASPKGQHERILQSDVESFKDMEFMQYNFNTLKMATRDFSPENKLGEGGFGIVYKGTLENGQPLAIKRLSDTSDQGTKQFMTEARFLAKLQHKNLVKLVGSCSDEDEKLLVYEFMPNSSLDRFLFAISVTFVLMPIKCDYTKCWGTINGLSSLVNMLVVLWFSYLF